jgi:hypothetical protein
MVAQVGEANCRNPVIALTVTVDSALHDGATQQGLLSFSPISQHAKI